MQYNKKAPAILQESPTGSAITDAGLFFCKDQIIDIGLVLTHIRHLLFETKIIIHLLISNFKRFSKNYVNFL